MQFPPIVFALALVTVSVLKHLTLKRCAIQGTSNQMCTFIGASMVTFSLFAVFFSADLRSTFMADIPDLFESGAPTLLLGFIILKGFFVWGILFLKQTLNQKTTSTSAYGSMMGLVVLGLVNFIQGEQLSFLHWISLILLSFLGVLYAFKGHLAQFSMKYKLFFVLVAFAGFIPAMTDQAVKSEVSWFTSLFLSNVSLLAMGLLVGGKASFEALARNARTPKFIQASFTWIVFEVVVLFVMFEKLPVSLSEASRYLYVPIWLFLASIIYKEGTVKQQLGWGVATFCASVPMFLSPI
jgi:hypothetical protein